MGGPIDPLANATRAVHFARAHDLGWFDRCVISRVPEGYAGAGRLVYPGSLQLQTFLGYVARHSVEKDEVFWKFVADDGEDPFSFPFSLLSMSMMDLTREFFLENLQAVYREPALMAGTMEVGGVPVDLSAITRTALMTVEGERDDLCAPGQTRGAHALCPRIPENRRARLLVPGSGHFSLFHGRTCRKTVVPAITAFWAGLGA